MLRFRLSTFQKKTHSTKQHKNSPRMNFFINNHGTIKTFYCAFRIQRYELSNQVSIHHYLVLQWQKSLNKSNLLLKMCYLKYLIFLNILLYLQTEVGCNDPCGSPPTQDIVWFCNIFVLQLLPFFSVKVYCIWIDSSLSLSGKEISELL